MKKMAAILLLGIFLFNWIGYRVLTGYWQDAATARLETLLDRQQYDESQLVSIKIPLTHLSYYNSSTSFERVDGHIDIEGIPYQYVKQRIYKDSLELLCIPNRAALTLQSSGDNYFKLVNGIERSRDPQENSHHGSLRTYTSDPYTVIEPFIWQVRPSQSSPFFSDQRVQLPSPTTGAAERPPETFA